MARKRFSAEEKIRIVLAGPRGKDSIAEPCRQESIAQGLYFRWPLELSIVESVSPAL